MNRKYKILCLTVVGTVTTTLAQDVDEKRVFIPASALTDTVRVDTLSLIPGSVHLFVSGTPVDSNVYQHDDARGRIFLNPVWREGLNKNDTLLIRYRTLPYLISERAQNKVPEQWIQHSPEVSNPFTYKPSIKNPTQDLFGFSSLSRSGNLTRGIMIGNNQDLSVNSSMDLQFSGKLNDQMEVRAAISDDNIPIQPDGNTAAIQDFDQVYIELSSHDSKLIAGDFQLISPQSHWLHFNKRNQGLGYETAFNMADSQRVSVSANVAVSKGKFARQIVPGQEGNQGPYRLRGAENETYIVVLAGTERVYLNGMLLERGQENDYVINYNTAEVTFTARRMITKDSRLVFEFQYTDRNYARSMIFARTGWQGRTSDFQVSVYSEQDNKNQPLQQDLSQGDKQLLSDAGDDPTKAVRPAVDSVGFGDSEVRYVKIDSAGYTVYVYSTDPTKAVYRLAFTYVGTGKGNYKQIKSAANGRVFQWVMPQAGIPQGDYEPVRQLIAPKNRRMVTARWAEQLSRRSSFTAEGAWSEQDQNLFSSLDSHDDHGPAISLSWDRRMPNDTSRQWRTSHALSYEFQHRYFKPVERIRTVEFERDWNLSALTDTTSQHFGGFLWQAQYKKQLEISWDIRTLLRDTVYKGIRNACTLRWAPSRWRANAKVSLLNANGSDIRSGFLRYDTGLERLWGQIRLGVLVEGENNTLLQTKGDSLIAPSASWNAWQVYLASRDSTRLGYKLYYGERNDDQPTGRNLIQAFHAQQAGLDLSVIMAPGHRFRGSVAWRSLEVIDTTLTDIKPEEVLNIRLEHRYQAKAGWLRSSLFYESSSGLELKKEFIYLEVPSGQGNFSWTDYNGNGVKELDEFEVALFPDQARYIRVFTPTQEYVKVYNQQFSHAVFIQPTSRKQEPSALRRLADRFSNQFSYRLQRKTGEQATLDLFNYTKELNGLVSVNAGLRNTVSFNRNKGKVGVDMQWLDAFNRTLLINGPEWTRNRTWQTTGRWTMSKVFTFQLMRGYGNKVSRSEFFVKRNYLIRSEETEGKFTYQPNPSNRWSVIMNLGHKQNAVEYGDEEAFKKEGAVEASINVPDKGSVMSRISYVFFEYNGEQNSPLGFEMLSGLRTGRNFTWSLGWQRNLAKNLQLELQYSGRKPGALKTIHTGSAQVRAFF
ncbi:MAG: hypothetical protein KDD36_03370 [Flavobacteriales bacterium]|nr:hypothetical protein [Flavobacteriales bacterium]